MSNNLLQLQGWSVNGLRTAPVISPQRTALRKSGFLTSFRLTQMLRILALYFGLMAPFCRKTADSTSAALAPGSPSGTRSEASCRASASWVLILSLQQRSQLGALLSWAFSHVAAFSNHENSDLDASPVCGILTGRFTGSLIVGSSASFECPFISSLCFLAAGSLS